VTEESVFAALGLPCSVPGKREIVKGKPLWEETWSKDKRQRSSTAWIYSPKLMHISAYLIELVAINGLKLELKREFGSFTFTHPSPISHVSFSLSFKY
jgi:hypothetical protein